MSFGIIAFDQEQKLNKYFSVALNTKIIRVIHILKKYNFYYPDFSPEYIYIF